MVCKRPPDGGFKIEKTAFMANFAKKVVSYFIESKQELAKVTWPNRKDTTRYTLMVIGISLGVGVFFFVLDWLFNQGLSAIINL